MKLADVQNILGAQLVWDSGHVDRVVRSCHASDLISDLLTYQGPSALLLTGLTNAQVIRTAEILDFIAICFVRGKQPQADTLELAKKSELPLFVTDLTMYESCGLLYKNGLPGTTKREGNDNCQTKI